MHFSYFSFWSLTFVHSLRQPALAIMAVTSCSFHQASPSVLQQPFFSPSVQSSSTTSPLIPYLHLSVSSFKKKKAKIFSSSTFGLRSNCFFNLMLQDAGCLLMCLPCIRIKEQHCFHCTHCAEQRGFTAVPFVPNAHPICRNIAVSPYFHIFTLFLPSNINVFVAQRVISDRKQRPFADSHNTSINTCHF